jgi:hypothetical protein
MDLDLMSRSVQNLSATGVASKAPPFALATIFWKYKVLGIQRMRRCINFQPQGKVNSLGGFPLTVKQGTSKSHKHRFEIDLSSKFPGQRIVIVTMKEFVRVDFENASEEAYANAVGLLGDFKTGKTRWCDSSSCLFGAWQ